MKDFKFGDYVWYRHEGWQYLGMDEDGAIQVCRPVKGHPFNIIEFEQIYIGEDSEEVDQFYKDNGECLTEYCNRKGIPLPEQKQFEPKFTIKDYEHYINQ